MPSDRWDEVEATFHRLQQMDLAARQQAVAELATSDPALAAEVASLLAAHDTSGPLDRLAAALGPLSQPPADRDHDRAGQHVQQYEILALAGEGGMGVVYRARDSRLLREVALKFMPEWLGQDPAARDRFLQEARAASSLDHPNVCTLFEAAFTDDGKLFLAMPFYEGESLAARLARGPMPWREAVEVARQAALGLAAAHARGIIHRDIKPANLFATADGRIKILDFGIAKLADTNLSLTGERLGTIHYMSPEQIAGEAVDARSDLWSLGVVLHEALSGKRPVLGTVPGPNLKGIPPSVVQILKRSLQLAPADRYQDAGTLATDLEAALHEAPPPTGVSAMAQRLSGGHPRLLAAVVALLLVALAVVAYRRLRSDESPGITFGRASRLGWQSGLVIDPVPSPDGRFVAYAVGTGTHPQVYVRQVDGERSIPLTPGDDASESGPTWSPDGSRVLFLSGGAVFSAPFSGGPPRPEVRARDDNPITSAEWSPDGRRIAFAAGDSLFVQDSGATPRFVALVRSPNGCRWAPDGHMLACASGNSAYDVIGPLFGNLAASSIVLVSPTTGERRFITDSASLNQTPVWSHDGRSVYFISNRDGPLDIYAVSVRHPEHPVRLTTGLGAQSIALSATGSKLAYSVIRDIGNIWKVPRGPGPLSLARAVPVTRGTLAVDAFSVSHDGKWLIYSADLAGNGDIYLMPLPSGDVRRLTTDPAGDFSPDMSPGPEHEVAFQSWRAGNRDIYVERLDGGGVVRVAGSPRQEVMPRWSPDGESIAFAYWDPVGGVAVVRRDPRGHWSEPVAISGVGTYPAWSPDGQTIAYTTAMFGGTLMEYSFATGTSRAVLTGPADSMPKAEISFYSRDGRSLIFTSRDDEGVRSLWQVPAGGGRPTRILRFDDPEHPVYRPYWAMTSDAIYFVVQEQQSETWVMDVEPN